MALIAFTSRKRQRPVLRGQMMMMGWPKDGARRFGICESGVVLPTGTGR
jgi:hypothetical protein